MTNETDETAAPPPRTEDQPNAVAIPRAASPTAESLDLEALAEACRAYVSAWDDQHADATILGSLARRVTLAASPAAPQAGKAEIASDYVRGEGPSPYRDVPSPCTSPRHAHALNDAEAAKGGPDEDPVTWSHCTGCHGDDYDHGTDLTGPHCGHFAGCPNC